MYCVGTSSETDAPVSWPAATMNPTTVRTALTMNTGAVMIVDCRSRHSTGEYPDSGIYFRATPRHPRPPNGDGPDSFLKLATSNCVCGFHFR